MKVIDQLTDEVENILESNTAVTSRSGLSALIFTRTSTLHPIINDELVHSVVCNANYKYIR